MLATRAVRIDLSSHTNGQSRRVRCVASLLQRLKERKLVQWALAYLAGAFVVVQLLDAVAEALALSSAVQLAVLVVVAVGFFVTLVLSWYHGEKGRQRVSGPELLMVAALLVIAGGVLAMLRGGQEVSEPTEDMPFAALDDDRPAIAVLPFTDMSAEGDQRYFGDGIADEILNSLTRISGLRVAARTSAFKLRDEDVATVGDRLRVGSVLEGSVRRVGDRVRITAQLIQVQDGFHLWSDTYDRVIEDLFAVQEEIAEAIADALEVELGLQPKGARARGLTDDLEAYQLYLLGRDRWATRSPETIREAIEYFELAIEKDSTFALAYTGIADAYMVLPFYGLTVEPLDVYEPAKAAALRAHELNPDLGETHATLGYIAHTYEWDWQAAERYFSTALELAPGYASAHHWYANLLSTLGQLDRSAQEMEIALSLDPLSNVLVWSTANRLSGVGRTEEARAQYERATQMEPVVPWALWGYAEDLLRFEPLDVTRAADLFGEFTTLFGYPDPDRAGGAFVGRGESTDGLAEYLALLDDLTERTVLDRTDLLLLYVPPVPADVTWDVLEDAMDARHYWVPYVRPTVSVYAPELMEDPRWETFLSRIGNPGSRE